MHAAPSQSKLVGTTLEAQKIHEACAQLEKCCRKDLLELSNGVWVVPGDGERSEHCPKMCGDSQEPA